MHEVDDEEHRQAHRLEQRHHLPIRVVGLVSGGVSGGVSCGVGHVHVITLAAQRRERGVARGG
eukprot:scaffold95337_cov60-Phaeocystis_antarctica.AAC.1